MIAATCQVTRFPGESSKKRSCCGYFAIQAAPTPGKPPGSATTAITARNKEIDLQFSESASGARELRENWKVRYKPTLARNRERGLTRNTPLWNAHGKARGRMTLEPGSQPEACLGQLRGVATHRKPVGGTFCRAPFSIHRRHVPLATHLSGAASDKEGI